MMSESLCAGKARELHVKFGVLTTSLISAVGSTPLRGTLATLGTEARPQAKCLYPLDNLIKPSF